MSNVGIVGGGIAGMASAYRLAAEGHDVTLYEAGATLGGLGETFDHEGIPFEKYYHVLLDSDAHLLALLRELGLMSRLVWRETGMGIIHDRRHYPFNTPIDLLRFGAVSLPHRVRTGMAALYITALKRHGLDLDDELAVPWLKKLFGDQVFHTIWEPLLAAKFGERRDVVPAYWVWNTLNREKNGKQEVKGYVRGGYGAITDALAKGIRERGAKIAMGTPVRTIESTDGHATVVTEAGRVRHDAVIATPPLALLRRLLSPELERQLTCGEVQFQGVVNVVLLLTRRLSPYYWTAVVDSGFPFQGIVETTHVIPLDSVGGRHVAYLMNYCEPGSEPYDRTDDEQRRGAVQGLLSLYPDFREQDVEASYVFRTPWVEPVWTRGYLKRRPEPRLGSSRVFLCTTAQAYPMVTAWNTSVKLATDAVNAVRGCA